MVYLEHKDFFIFLFLIFINDIKYCWWKIVDGNWMLDFNFIWNTRAVFHEIRAIKCDRAPSVVKQWNVKTWNELRDSCDTRAFTFILH